MFSENLRRLRKASGMTQQEIANHLGMERSTYAYYETGTTEPSLKRLQRIAAEFSVSVDEMLRDAGADPVIALRQDSGFSASALDAAGRMRECDREERAFISMLRHLDGERRKKLYLACLDLLNDDERNASFDRMFKIEE